MRLSRGGARAAIAVLAVGLTAAPIAAAAACLARAELDARRVRLLQTELMVAALSCKHGEAYDYSDQYNAFVIKFRSALQQHAQVLKQEYRRTYGAQHETLLDRYVTRIANAASERSLHRPNYCVSVRPLFEEVLALKASELPRYSERLAATAEDAAVACAAAPGKQAAQQPLDQIE